MSFTGKLAVIGAGIGGLALAGFLSRRGVSVTIYEQARGFQRLGAGIQMSPNATRVLRALGLEPRVRQLAFAPRSWSNRVWDTGENLFDFAYGAEAEAKYGAPYLLMHRGDLHEALASTVPPESIAFNKTLVGIERTGAAFTLRFADGTGGTADAIVGADGVHSTVREILLGAEKPRFTGRIAHRTVFPSALMNGYLVDTCTKWWGPDRHIVIYPVNPRRDETYFVTSVPDPSWDVESWSAKGDMDAVRRAFASFHDEVQRVLANCPSVHQWALFERDPLPRWTDGAIALLGDACHPMTPYMAQGAATALEDAAMIARCLDASDDAAASFRRYETARHARTARIQLTSRQNTWGKGRTDPSWVYGYDVFEAPITEASGATA